MEMFTKKAWQRAQRTNNAEPKKGVSDRSSFRSYRLFILSRLDRSHQHHSSSLPLHQSKSWPQRRNRRPRRPTSPSSLVLGPFHSSRPLCRPSIRLCRPPDSPHHPMRPHPRSHLQRMALRPNTRPRPSSHRVSHPSSRAQMATLMQPWTR